MQQKDWWKIFNICLGILLLGLVVFIIMMVMGMRTAGNNDIDTGNKQIEEYYKPKEDKTETGKTVDSNSGKTIDTNSNKKTKNTDNSSTIVANDKKTVDDEIDKETDLSTSSGIANKDKKSGEKVELIGKLENADEKNNEFEGNYRLIAEGNTDYTYLWFSGDFKKYVDGLVGKDVTLEIKYQDDGTFNIISGPTLVK